MTTVAEAYLSVLRDRQVSRLFVNAAPTSPLRRGLRPAEGIGAGPPGTGHLHPREPRHLDGSRRLPG